MISFQGYLCVDNAFKVMVDAKLVFYYFIGNKKRGNGVLVGMKEYMGSLSIKDIVELKKETQIDFIKEWFFAFFNDPDSESLPWDSEEDSYAYIYGGPYQAIEILSDEFESYIDFKVLEEVANEINNERDCNDTWVRKDYFEPDDDFYEIDAVMSGRPDGRTFDQKLNDLVGLMDLGDNCDEHLRKRQLQMVFISCISVFENYLYEEFSQRILRDADKKKKFLGADESIKDMKLKNVFNEKFQDLDAFIKIKLMDKSYHNIKTLEKMLADIFNLNGYDFKKLKEYIHIRHDLVHRDGKGKDGNLIEIDKEKIKNLIETIKYVCEEIREKLDSNKLGV